MTVRELIVELSVVEDALRSTRRSDLGQPPSVLAEVDVPALVRREQQLVHELRRRARARQRGRRTRSGQPL